MAAHLSLKRPDPPCQDELSARLLVTAHVCRNQCKTSEGTVTRAEAHEECNQANLQDFIAFSA